MRRTSTRYGGRVRKRKGRGRDEINHEPSRLDVPEMPKRTPARRAHASPGEQRSSHSSLQRLSKAIRNDRESGRCKMKCPTCNGSGQNEGKVMQLREAFPLAIIFVACSRCMGKGRICDECQNPARKRSSLNHLDLCVACTARIMEAEGGR